MIDSVRPKFRDQGRNFGAVGQIALGPFKREHRIGGVSATQVSDEMFSQEARASGDQVFHFYYVITELIQKHVSNLEAKSWPKTALFASPEYGT